MELEDVILNGDGHLPEAHRQATSKHQVAKAGDQSAMMEIARKTGLIKVQGMPWD